MDIGVEGWVAVGGLLLTVVGGVGGWMANRLSMSTSLVQQTYDSLVARIRALEAADKSRAVIERDLRNTVDLLEKKNLSLIHKVEQLEVAQMDLPFPMWLKDTSGMMLSFNRRYEEVFLIPRGVNRERYLGATDYDVWPEDVAKEFVRHDEIVKRTKKPWHGVEDVLMASGKTRQFVIVKFPRLLGGVIIGVGGIAVPREFEPAFLEE